MVTVDDSTTAEELTAFLKAAPASTELHQRIAQHPSRTPELLSQLARLASPILQSVIAADELADEDALTHMARSPVADVGMTVLRRQDLAESTILELARSRHQLVRLHVANHACATSEALMLLGFDSDANVAQTATAEIRKRRTGSATA